MSEIKIEQLLKEIKEQIENRDKLLIDLTKEIALLRLEIKEKRN